MEVHFSTADPFPVLENVLTELQSKGLFIADVSSLGKERNAEEQMKRLVFTVVSRDSKEALAELFEITSGLGITFSNLPEVSPIIIIHTFYF